ncbi:MAG: NAD-dependent epimerase/dehydratase family protein [Dehalococcoidia bacterium]
MKVLVTGAGGFIGGYLLKRLLEGQHEVRGLALDEADAERIRRSGDVEVLFGDVRDIESLRAAARGMEVVLHAAARVTDWGPWREFEAVTVRGTENMLQAAVEAGVQRFLLFSTSAVYAEAPPGAPPLDESAPYGGPRSPWGFYGRSKILAEQAALGHHREGRLGVTIVRPVSVYGPGDHTFFPRIIRFLRGPTAAWISGRDPLVPFLYVADLVEGVVAAGTSERAVGQIYNLGPDPEMRMREFVLAICDELDIRPPRLSVPYAVASTLANLSEGWARLIGAKEPPTLSRVSVFLMTQDQRFDISKARGDLDWEPKVSMAEGVRMTAQWVREAGLLG